MAPVPEGGEEADEGELGMDLNKSKKKKKKKVRPSLSTLMPASQMRGCIQAGLRPQSYGYSLKRRSWGFLGC